MWVLLKQKNVSRLKRKEILEEFERETINLRKTIENEYGIRYYDNKKAFAKGRWLFETFPASRESLAIKHEWNSMVMFKQWLIREGAFLIEGRTAPQGMYLSGGKMQKFVLDLNDLIE